MTSAFIGFRKLASIWWARADRIVTGAGATPAQRFADRQQKEFWGQMAEDAAQVAEQLEREK